ncbi:hypothetical protein [uncultured Cohaesibacter sp.]|nr:hypothetical protein [uncultured Cohaesibacter sp.]
MEMNADIKITRKKDQVVIKTDISTFEIKASRVPELSKALLEVAGYIPQ